MPLDATAAVKLLAEHGSATRAARATPSSPNNATAPPAASVLPVARELIEALGGDCGTGTPEGAEIDALVDFDLIDDEAKGR
ncbi:hypothetical protein [Streptomyces griseus]|uniref:hypothetical protein n=1 Tax=Streptomyces griseus TaxID=1911 RepID=UPI0033A89922